MIGTAASSPDLRIAERSWTASRLLRRAGRLALYGRYLAQPDVESLLIEINQNLDDHREMVRELNAMGFMHDPAQAARAERKDGGFKGVAEYIFRRR